MEDRPPANTDQTPAGAPPLKPQPANDGAASTPAAAQPSAQTVTPSIDNFKKAAVATPSQPATPVSSPSPQPTSAAPDPAAVKADSAVSSEEAVKPAPDNTVKAEIPDPELADMVQSAEDEYKAGTAQPRLKDDKPKKKKRNFKQIFSDKRLLMVLAAVFLIGIGLLYFFLLRTDSEPLDPPVEVAVEQSRAQAITVRLEESTLEYSDDAGQSWRELTEEVEITEGMWLRATDDTGSRGVIVLEDTSEIRLDEDARIVLDTVQTDVVKLVLRSGRAYARVAESNERKFTIATNALEVQSLSTAFTVNASIATDVVEVFEGSVQEKSTDQTIKQGQSMSHNNDSKVTDIKDLSVEDVKNDDFLIWNRQLDAADAIFKNKLGILDDIESPELQITAPKNEDTILLKKNDTISLTFEGTAEVNATIRISEGSADKVDSPEVSADGSGKFKYLLETDTALNPGETKEIEYTVAAVDKNGNKSIERIKLTFQGEIVDEITLAAISQPGAGVILNWNFSEGLEAPDGVKVVWNLSGQPQYPLTPTAGECNKDQGILDAPTGSTAVACLIDGRTYKFRVCKYIAESNSCDLYSNELTIKAPTGGSD